MTVRDFLQRNHPKPPHLKAGIKHSLIRALIKTTVAMIVPTAWFTIAWYSAAIANFLNS